MITPRIEDRSELHITGLSETYDEGSFAAGIPAQWQRFIPHLGSIPGQDSAVTYGVCQMDGKGMTYVCGVASNADSAVPEGLTKIILAPQRYAKFRHDGSVFELRKTWTKIFEEWLPTAGVTRADAPDLEWYSEDFDPMAGTGYVEIWIPIEA